MTNENTDILNGSKKADRTSNDLSLILELLGSNLEGLLDSVDLTKKLHKLGTKTELHQQIEKALKDPLQAAWDASLTVDKQFIVILEMIIKAFFNEHKNIVETVYKTKTTGNDLHFSVVLKEDKLENRNAVYEFFDSYETTEYSEKFPIYFQIVPPELISKIYTEKRIF